MLATDGTWPETGEAGDNWRAAVAPALVASLVVALSIAIFLFARRVSGALESELAPIRLALTATGLVAWACAVRARLGDRRVDWLLAVVLALFAIACSFPGSRAIDWLVWLTAFAAFGLFSACHNARDRESDKRADYVLQQLTRSRATDGCETIRGTLVAEFAVTERTAVLHVAFCPPFERLPRVDCETVAGPECEIKVAQILHQGARLEVRLARASTAAEQVTIEILATALPPLAE